MSFDNILSNTLKNEGGETTDSGGHTNYGVTQSLYDAVSPSLGLPKKNVRDLKYGEVRKVYEEEFYKKAKIDKINSERLQGVVFDHAVNAGVPVAIKSLQKIVGAKEDGIIGKDTIKALDSYIEKYGEDVLGRELVMERANQYADLVTQDPQKYGRYQNGWFNRLANVQKQYNLELS